MNSQDADLQARADRLQGHLTLVRQRLTTLESQRDQVVRCRRVLLLALGAALVGAGVEGLLAQQVDPRGGTRRTTLNAPATEIVCRSLKVVDPDGNEQATLGFDGNGGVVKLNSREGKLRSILWSDSGRHGGLVVLSSDDDARVRLGSHAKGGAGNFLRPGNHIAVQLGCASDNAEGLVQIFNAQGKLLVDLSEEQDGGLILVNGHDGKGRLTLSVCKEDKEGMLDIYNQQGNIIAGLAGDKVGGTVWVNDHAARRRSVIWVNSATSAGEVSTLNAANKIVASLTAGNNGGEVHVLGSDGKLRVGLGTRASGKYGFLGIFNDMGKAVAKLGVDERGGQLDFLTNEDKTIVAVGCAVPFGATLGLNDTRGKIRAVLGSGPGGGGTAMYGRQGEKQVALGSTDDGIGGLFSLWDSRESNLIYAGPNAATGGGLLKVMGQNGKIRVGASVHTDGVGFVETYDAAGQMVRTLR